MARIVLISCNLTDEPYPVYPLGMSLVANAVRVTGHDVTEFDFYTAESRSEIFDKVKEIKPLIIGLSLRNVDNVRISSGNSYLSGYKSAVSELKVISNAYIVLGGSAFTIFPERFLRETGADYGIKGEGESAFINLITELEKGIRPEKGIFQSTSSLDNFGSFERNKDLAEFYLNKGGMLNIQTKRGCPHRCLYCSYPHLEGEL